jgi:hypothetical protein
MLRSVRPSAAHHRRLVLLRERDDIEDTEPLAVADQDLLAGLDRHRVRRRAFISAVHAVQPVRVHRSSVFRGRRRPRGLRAVRAFRTQRKDMARIGLEHAREPMGGSYAPARMREPLMAPLQTADERSSVYVSSRPVRDREPREEAPHGRSARRVGGCTGRNRRALL